MNFRHFMLIALTVFILISPVCGEEIDYLNQTTKITFEGVEFMIPLGFGEVETEDYTELGSQGKRVSYISEYGGEIIITVASDWMGMSLDELYKEGANKTTINNHKGWKYKEGNLTTFGYVDGDNAIILSVFNETRLSEVII